MAPLPVVRRNTMPIVYDSRPRAARASPATPRHLRRGARATRLQSPGQHPRRSSQAWNIGGRRLRCAAADSLVFGHRGSATLDENSVDGLLVLNVGDTGIVREYAGIFFQADYSGSSTVSGTARRVGNTTDISLSASRLAR